MRFIREKIDSIDGKINALLLKRLALAVKIGKEKEKLGLVLYQPAREQEVLHHIKGRYQRERKRIFKVIMQESRGVQRK